MIVFPSVNIHANTDGDSKNNQPPVIVPFSESGLPILMINTGGQVLYKETYKLVRVVIINNPDGINYADTIAHPDQTIDYTGLVKLKYHGNSSFKDTDKPPFTMKTMENDTDSKKANLLGMGKAKKWNLIAPFMDRSCIRDKFIYDIFRPYFDFVPDSEPVEVMIDGVYRGIYYVTEKIGLNKHRIDAKDPAPDTASGDITGGYVLRIDRNDDVYTSNAGTKYNDYFTSNYTINSTFSKKYIYYGYIEPDMEDMVDGGVGNQSWINTRVNDFEKAIKNNDFSYVDMNSFAAYMLATEFARNVDGYRLSTYMFKYSDDVDKRFKMTLWDFDRSLGNSKDDNATDVNTWSYDFNSRHITFGYYKEDYLVPFYWESLRNNADFMHEAKSLWTKMRTTTMTDDQLMAKIDELTNRLVSTGAQGRNDKAYKIWTRGYIKPITDTQKAFTSIGQEIDYIKDFIRKRIAVMDKAFYDESTLVPDPTYYTIAFKSFDGEQISSETVEEGKPITVPSAPKREGYTFAGWSPKVSDTAIANAEYTATYTVNKYKLIYTLDGEEYQSSEVEYGTELTQIEALEKEGYAFSGWSELPKTMPAEDVTITGSFSINSYKLVYTVDGEEYNSTDIAFGSEITPLDSLKREGYTFSGWSEIPSTMPAKDLTITGTFSINSYKLIYKVDGEEYLTAEIPFGSEITPADVPEKEGYTFSGWSEIPETMPAKDVTIEGTFTIDPIYFDIAFTDKDGNVISQESVLEGNEITVPDAPKIIGYTFDCWKPSISNTAVENVSYKPVYKVNQYDISYMWGDAEVNRVTLDYEATIPSYEFNPNNSERYTYIFEGWKLDGSWFNMDTMPAYDIVLYAEISVVDDISLAMLVNSNSKVYTLTGVFVGKGADIKSLKKGLYVIDGRKVFVK